MEDTKEKVVKIIANVSKKDVDIAATNDFTKLGIDSIDAVTIAFAIEEEFNISIPDDSVYAIKSVDELAAKVAEQLSKKTSRIA